MIFLPQKKNSWVNELYSTSCMEFSTTKTFGQMFFSKDENEIFMHEMIFSCMKLIVREKPLKTGRVGNYEKSKSGMSKRKNVCK